MDKNTKDLGGKLLQEIKEANSLLRSFRHPRENDDKPDKPEKRASEEHAATQGKVSLLTHINPPPKTADKSKNKWYQSFEGWKSAIEFGAMFFAIGYAIVTYFQWNDAKHNFIVDQRAWLGTIEVSTPPELHEGTVLDSAAYLVNTGKTPAFRVIQRAGFRIIPATEKFDPAYEVAGTAPIGEGVIFPSGKRLMGIDSLGAINGQRANELNYGTYRLYLFGEITYDDAFGKSHYTRFCMRMELGQKLAFAPYGNYDDAN